MKRILIFIGLLWLLVGLVPSAMAEDISALTDAEVRQLLIERLDDKEVKPEKAFNPAQTAWRFQQGFSQVKLMISFLLCRGVGGKR